MRANRSRAETGKMKISLSLRLRARGLRAAARCLRAAIALAIDPPTQAGGRFTVCDGLDPLHFRTRSAALAYGEWMSELPDSHHCEITVMDGEGRIRTMETSSPTWYKWDGQSGNWVLNLSNPDVADAYWDPADHIRW